MPKCPEISGLHVVLAQKQCLRAYPDECRCNLKTRHAGFRATNISFLTQDMNTNKNLSFSLKEGK